MDVIAALQIGKVHRELFGARILSGVITNASNRLMHADYPNANLSESAHDM